MADFEGGCACGAVRYRLKSKPMFVQCCHCKDCQRQTGGPFAVNGLIEADRIELLSGEPKPISMRTDSGRPHLIYRCPDCATALWSDYGDRKVMSFLRVTTLDDAAEVPPNLHIFTKSKLPWVRLPPDAKAFEVYYDMRVEWPADSLARREALLGPGR
jgi:hypothetical protein